MATFRVVVRRWTWGICCMYSFTLLLRVANCSLASSMSKLAANGAKRVRFTSPAEQLADSSNAAQSQSTQTEANPVGQEVLTYVQTVYPRESGMRVTPVNATVPQQSLMSQPAPAGWTTIPVLPGVGPHAVTPGQIFTTAPAGVPFAAPPVLPESPDQVSPVMPLYPPAAVTHQIMGASMHPSLPAPFTAPPDMLRSLSPAAPVVTTPYMILAHPPQDATHTATGSLGEKDMWAAKTRESQLPATPSFVPPRGKQRTHQQLMDELRQQEELRRSKRLSPSRPLGIPSGVTKGLAVVGAVVAAKKTAQGLAQLYKWARGVPGGS